MNYYKRNIGDYAAAARHLSILEHGVYMLMLDLYYTTEKPLGPDLKDVCRRVGARSTDEMQAVESVLNDFFCLQDDGWHQPRCDDELALFHSKAETNRVTGKLGGRPRKETQTVSTVNPEITQTVSETNPHETLTTNQEPITKDTPIPPSGAELENISAKQKAAVAFPTWLESIKATGEKPIPENDPVFSYANQVGIPPEHLRLCWREFRDRYSQPGAKRYRDWRGVFRKAVRGNWLKLWWIDGDGAYSLTTTGKQAEKAAS